MAGETRDLTLKLKVVDGGGNAPKVMATLAEQAQKAEQALGKAHQALNRMNSPGSGMHPGGPGAGLAGGAAASALSPAAYGGTSRVSAFDRPIPVVVVGPKSLIDGLTGRAGPGAAGANNPGGGGGGDGAGVGGKAGLVALAAAAAWKAAEITRDTAVIGNDSYRSREQKARDIARLNPVARMTSDTYEAVTGRTDAMERERVRFQQQQVEFTAASERVAFAGGMHPRMAEEQERYRQLRTARPVVMGPIDRRTAEGQQRYEELSRLLPLEREEAKLKREVEAAAKGHARAAFEVGHIEKELTRLRTDEQRLQRTIRAGGTGPGYLRAFDDLESIQGAIARAESNKVGMIQNRDRYGRQEAQARRAAEGAGIATAREQAAILEDKAARAAAGAHRLGGMDPVSRMWGVESLKLVQANAENLSSLPPEILQAAMALAPQTVGKLVEGHGAKSREFDALRQLAPVDFPDDPEALRRQSIELSDKSVRRDLRADADLAKQAQDASLLMYEATMKAMTLIAEQYKQLIETQHKASKVN